jgi:AcrR family transcriptional regulator
MRDSRNLLLVTGRYAAVHDPAARRRAPGFGILADGDPGALRVDRLCERLGVTKGSFYWHFADLAAYRIALVEAWGSLQDQDRQRFENMPDVEPRQRLRTMMAAVVSPQQYALERAMRVWAITDEIVANSVRKSDRRVLRAVYKAFVDSGFEPGEAGVRSMAFFAAGMGLLHATDPAVDAPAEVREQFLDFMLRP